MAPRAATSVALGPSRSMALSMSVNTNAGPPTRTSGPRPRPSTADGELTQVVGVPGVDAKAVVRQDDSPACSVPLDVRPGELLGDVGVAENAQPVGRPRTRQGFAVGVVQRVRVAKLAIDQPADLGQHGQLLVLIGG